MASTYLTRTFSTATDRKIWTWSAWVKRQNLVSDHANAMFGAYYDATNRSVIRFNGHRLQFQDSANSVDILTTRKFKDQNAWYHIVARVDTTQSTASDRIRLYVNGEQETAFDTSSYPGQNINMEFQGAVAHYINARHSGSAVDSIASMTYSHVHFADGQSLAPTVFGSTDSTTGEWKINTSPSFTLGTNGFTILKDGNTYTDQSSNSNNWSLGAGTLTNTEDCPSNVFATLNPLIPATSGTPTFGKGNTTYKSTASSWDSGLSTIMPSSGKWYFEVKPMDNDNTMIGLVDIQRNPEFASGTSTYGYLGYKGMSYQAYSNGTAVVYRDNSNAHTGLTGWSAGNICGVAIDLDNQEMFLHINGTYTNSGNPATRANPYDFSTFVNSGNNVAMGVSSRNNYVTYVNFGNGYFHTTAVASAGTNASGNGIFEYDVPSGFTALSTKGLNE
jgi:hypothetical protein